MVAQQEVMVDICILETKVKGELNGEGLREKEVP